MDISCARVALTLREIEMFDPSVNGLVIGQGRGEQRALCPLCGVGKPRDAAHRSLSLNRGTGAWRCHRCGEGGKVKEMWEEASPLSRRDRARVGLTRAFDLSSPVVSNASDSSLSALATISVEVPVAPDTSASSNSWKRELRDLHLLNNEMQCNSRGASYLRGRGLSVEHAVAAGTRFCPRFMGRPALVFPLRDHNGHLRGAHARYVDGRDRPKARTVGDKRQSLFATEGALAMSLPALILTEAPLDALSLAEAGYPALAFCGTQPPAWLHRVSAFRRVLLAFDADDAGDHAADELAQVLGSFGARCERMRPENAKDWNDVLRSGRDQLADWLASRIL